MKTFKNEKNFNVRLEKFTLQFIVLISNSYFVLRNDSELVKREEEELHVARGDVTKSHALRFSSLLAEQMDMVMGDPLVTDFALRHNPAAKL